MPEFRKAPKAPWEPEWAVRVRIKSTGMTMLGTDEQGNRRSASQAPDRTPRPEGPLPGIGDVLKGVKGLFGN